MLPDYDVIPSLIPSKGMLRLDRWPNSAREQIKFLQEVQTKFGPHATVNFVQPYDGYPGYILIGRIT